jgi:hypothetical protein
MSVCWPENRYGSRTLHTELVASSLWVTSLNPCSEADFSRNPRTAPDCGVPSFGSSPSYEVCPPGYTRRRGPRLRVASRSLPVRDVSRLSVAVRRQRPREIHSRTPANRRVVCRYLLA